ncbi:unnamed protein product [Arabidopsis lyrata]|nr:unnamed protein product [Arabidopsis lyrata]
MDQDIASREEVSQVEFGTLKPETERKAGGVGDRRFFKLNSTVDLPVVSSQPVPASTAQNVVSPVNGDDAVFFFMY